MSWPVVTVAIPALNEERNIAACLSAVSSQDYAGEMEILLVDGGSWDGTLRYASRHPGVEVLANPRRYQAAGLNTALAGARGEVFVRVDGHCVIAPDYVRRCVESLDRTGAAMVGGALDPIGGEGFGAAVARAMRSRLGAGAARFHRPGAPAGWVDTVYLGAFCTAMAREIGGYDESFRVNEDAEFAWRMGRSGGVWFEPTIRSTYRPRTTPASLARQFFRYGRGRARTALRHPRSVSARQLAAPALVVGLVSPWRLAVVTGYIGVLVVGAALARTVRPLEAARVSMAMAIMHLSWGVGFLSGLAPVAGTGLIRRRRGR